MELVTSLFVLLLLVQISYFGVNPGENLPRLKHPQPLPSLSVLCPLFVPPSLPPGLPPSDAVSRQKSHNLPAVPGAGVSRQAVQGALWGGIPLG